MKTKEQIMADLLRSQQNSRTRGQQMMAGEGYRPPQMSSNLPQTMSPNMINQSAGMRPGRTNVGQGRAAALAAQMRQAQANMSGDPAQGKTVSNGRIYVAPTWSEVLADGVKKGLGGYNAGQAREGLIEIDEEQAAEDAMDAEYEAMLLAQDNDYRTQQDAQKQANFETTLTREDGKEVTRVSERGEDLRIAETNLTGKNRRLENTAKLKPFHNPNFDPEQPLSEANSPVINVPINTITGEGIGTNVKNLIPYTPSDQGSGSDTQDLTAAQINSLTAKKDIVDQADKLISQINSLSKSGESSSGERGMLYDITPTVLRPWVSSVLFSQKEEEVRASITAFSAAMLEALTTGVLSDEDVVRMEGIRADMEGLQPYQQISKIIAAQNIMRNSVNGILSLSNSKALGGKGFGSGTEMPEKGSPTEEEELDRIIAG